MLLTPGEYDDLPPEAQAALAAVPHHPTRDKKNKSFRRRYGRYLNGELDADSRATSITGYGTGSPLAPHSLTPPVPPTPITPQGRTE